MSAAKLFDFFNLRKKQIPNFLYPSITNDFPLNLRVL
jgi:hypothetical protein